MKSDVLCITTSSVNSQHIEVAQTTNTDERCLDTRGHEVEEIYSRNQFD